MDFMKYMERKREYREQTGEDFPPFGADGRRMAEARARGEERERLEAARGPSTSLPVFGFKRRRPPWK